MVASDHHEWWPSSCYKSPSPGPVFVWMVASCVRIMNAGCCLQSPGTLVLSPPDAGPFTIHPALANLYSNYFPFISRHGWMHFILVPWGPDKSSKKSGEFARSVNIKYSILYSVYRLLLRWHHDLIVLIFSAFSIQLKFASRNKQGCPRTSGNGWWMTLWRCDEW